MTVQTFTKDIQDHFKKIRLCLKNRQEDTTIRIDPSKTKYEIDGITYNYGQTETAYRDDTWYISVAEKDRDLEGYLLLPKDAQNAKKIHMEITVLKDTNIGQIPTVVKFDISV